MEDFEGLVPDKSEVVIDDFFVVTKAQFEQRLGVTLSELEWEAISHWAFSCLRGYVQGELASLSTYGDVEIKSIVENHWS